MFFLSKILGVIVLVFFVMGWLGFIIGLCKECFFDKDNSDVDITFDAHLMDNTTSH